MQLPRKAAKTVTIVTFCVAVVLVIIAMFLDGLLETNLSYHLERGLGSLYPYYLIISGGVAGSGIVSKMRATKQNSTSKPKE